MMLRVRGLKVRINPLYSKLSILHTEYYIVLIQNFFCIPITFKSLLKACFSKKKYPITIQTHQTQIVKGYFLLKTRVFRLLVHKINYLSFFSDLVCNSTSKARISTPHTRIF